MRIPRDEVFMKTAFLFSERGTCLRAKVGCVITLNNRIVSTGYVGSLPGEPHCLDEGCIIDEKTGGCIRTKHAEANAIDFLEKQKGHTPGYTKLYVTMSPCIDCARKIVDFGIAKVVYCYEYRDISGLFLLKENSVEVEQYKGRIF